MHNLIHSMLALVSSAVAFAAEEHETRMQMTSGDSKRIIYHAIDLILLFAIIYYYAGAKLKTFFSSRGQKFDQAVKEAQRAREEAEHHNIQIKMKLKKLEESALSSVKKAEQDATEMKNNMVAEAKRVSERLMQESDNTIRNEYERATVLLKDEFTQAAIKEARANMKVVVTEPEQRRLEREFIEKIQVT